MPQGLQIWDAAGATVFDTTTRAGVALGAVNTGTVNGSVVAEGLALGEPFFFVIPDGTSFADAVPVVTISGTTIFWSFPSVGYRTGGVIVYGIK